VPFTIFVTIKKAVIRFGGILFQNGSINHLITSIMKKIKFGIILCLAILFSATFMGCRKWSETGTGSLRTVFNEGGQTLGYDTASGVKILTNKGFAFKDLNCRRRIYHLIWNVMQIQKVIPVISVLGSTGAV